MSTATVKLFKPVIAHGNEIASLAFREPTGDDIIQCGFPVHMGETVSTINTAAIAKYISRLAQVPPSTVRQLSAADFQRCVGAIIPFFADGEALEGMTS